VQAAGASRFVKPSAEAARLRLRFAVPSRSTIDALEEREGGFRVTLSLPTTASTAVEHTELAVRVDDPRSGFTGTFTPTRFAAEEGRLVVRGVVHGTIAGGVGIVERVSVPVSESRGAGATLRLRLEPLELERHGVRLPETELAAEGRSGLHVNLVCAVNQLLASSPKLALVPDLLNQILART
jgi:hypothetical protein